MDGKALKMLFSSVDFEGPESDVEKTPKNWRINFFWDAAPFPGLEAVQFLFCKQESKVLAKKSHRSHFRFRHETERKIVKVNKQNWGGEFSLQKTFF